MDRVRNFKLILWLLAGLGFSVACTRLLYGLGATTHLSDAVPWGFWIGFDVMGGVALAAGGFVITATVYILGREDFHAITRPAVLTAFLGYAAVIGGLLFDLGLPWNIWHMMIYWNPRSPLFEVGWCVMLYSTVLLLEFSPVPLESASRYARVRRALMKARLPLVILGVALSTLHQSSLGSLFLIMPGRVHPLWYSPLLPVLFFLSAVGLGMMMVTFESLFTAYLYRRPSETDLLARLGRAARWVLLLYLAVRLGDLVARGRIGDAFAGDRYAALFWAELLLSSVLPAGLLFSPRTRNRRGGLWAAALTGVAGFVFNRINTGGLAHLTDGGSLYVPAWSEIAVSAGVVAAAALAFLFAIERFNVWEERPDPGPARRETFPGFPALAGRAAYSLVFVLAAAAGFALLSGEALSSEGIDPTPVRGARGWETMRIDGNHDGFGADFPHKSHAENLGRDDSCVLCHHMNLPRDRNSGCHACHSDMYQPALAFNHTWHTSSGGANLPCQECHRADRPRSAETARPCSTCHRDLFPKGVQIQVTTYRAPSYVEAMHGLCLGCHAKTAAEMGEPALARCNACHGERREFVDAPDLLERYEGGGARGVVTPPRP